MIVMIALFTGVCAGTAIGLAMAPTKPEPTDYDLALERYRDAAAAFCEATLAGFGSTTQWDKWRKARHEYLIEAKDES